MKTLAEGEYLRVLVLGRKISQRLDEISQGRSNDNQGFADLEHRGCIHDVLSGSTPMDVFGMIFINHFRELLNKRQDWISYDVGVCRQLLEATRA